MASPPENNNPPPSPSPPSPTTETPPSPPTETPPANGDTPSPPKEAPAPEKASPPPPNEKSPPEKEKSPPPPEKNDSPPPPPPEDKDKGSPSPATPAPTTSPATPTPTPTAPTTKPTTPPAPGHVPATPTPPVPKTPGQNNPQPTPTIPTPTDAKTPPNNEPQSIRPPPPPNGDSESKPDSSAGQQTNDSGTPQSNGTTFLSENGKYIAIAAGVALFLVIAGLLTYYIINKKKKKPNVWPHGQMQYYGDPSQAFKGNNYYDTGHNQNWYGPPTMEQKGPPHAPPGYMATPGGGWTTSPQVISSGEMSSNFSDPHNAIGSASQAGLAFSKSTFTYDELAAATNGFAQANLLGQGGFGFVHKGVLANGTVVAVKSLKSGSGQGEREFQAEVDIISRVHHRHLVSLVGYCIAGGQRMLVYEFVPNKTLEYHLHGNSGETLDWSKRLTLAVGAAKGLAYLHEDCHPRIIHRDIKAANILLDNNFEAMVADFGLAKLTQDNFTHVSTRVMGTFGYLAPEYASSGKLTEKSDVFSFGVMLLELITGRRPVDTTNKYMEDSLVDWARPLMTTALEDGDYDELVDQRLGNAYNKNEMKRMMACASASVRHSAKRRPKMSQIVRALEGSVSLDDLDNATRAANQDYGSSGDYNTRAYNEDLKKFRKMALETTGEDPDDTSTYGINPSTSSDSSREMK